MCVFLGDEGIYSDNDDDLFRYARAFHSAPRWHFSDDARCSGRRKMEWREVMTGCDIKEIEV